VGAVNDKAAVAGTAATRSVEDCKLMRVGMGV
jgi:hypothetical protein